MRRATSFVLGGGSGAAATRCRFSAFARTNRGRFDLTGQAFLGGAGAGAGASGAGVTATGSVCAATGTGAGSAGGSGGGGLGAAGFLAGLGAWACSGSCSLIFLAVRDRFNFTSYSSGSGDSVT